MKFTELRKMKKVNRLNRDLQITIRHPNREQIIELQEFFAEATETNFVSAGRSMEIASAIALEKQNDQETRKLIKEIVSDSKRLNSLY